MKKNAKTSFFILFIAVLLISIITVGVLLQTSGSLSQSSFKTISSVGGEISKNIQILDLQGEDGTSQGLTDYKLRIKLAPGSDNLDLSKIGLSFISKGSSAYLTYRGENSVCENNNNNGYNTYSKQEIGQISVYDGGYFNGNWFIGNGFNHDILIDLDDDGVTDSVIACGRVAGTPCPVPYNGSYLRFTLSTEGIIYVPLRNDDNTLAILDPPPGGSFSITRENISSYGYITGSRIQSSAADQLQSGDTGTSFKIYKNPMILNEDLDEDGKLDKFAINKTHALFFISSTDQIAIPFNEALTGGNNLMVESMVSDSSLDYAKIIINGHTTTANQIDESVNLTIIPSKEGRGYFSISYDISNNRSQEGRLNRGDLVTLCFESPEPLKIFDDGKIILHSLRGSSSIIEFTFLCTHQKKTIPLFP